MKFKVGDAITDGKYTVVIVGYDGKYYQCKWSDGSILLVSENDSEWSISNSLPSEKNKYIYITDTNGDVMRKKIIK